MTAAEPAGGKSNSLFWRPSYLKHQSLLPADGQPIVKASLDVSQSASESGNR